MASKNNINDLPPEQIVFLQIDQAGAEALIVSYLTKHGRLRDLFLNGIKPHTYVAMHLFPKVWEAELGVNDLPIETPINEIKNWKYWKDLSDAIKKSDHNPPSKRYYYFGKQTCHSANYDIKARTFSMNILDKSEGEVILPVKEASRFLQVYHRLMPEIKLWHLEVETTLQAAGCLKNLFGYPRHLTQRVNSHTLKEYYAWIPQSTVGCITHLAGEALQRILDNRERDDFALMQNNHDSLLIQTRVKSVMEIKPLLQKAMNMRLLSPKGEIFHMKSEVCWGLNWRDMDEI